jgi:hypothetical protein
MPTSAKIAHAFQCPPQPWAALVRPATVAANADHELGAACR